MSASALTCIGVPFLLYTVILSPLELNGSERLEELLEEPLEELLLAGLLCDALYSFSASAQVIPTYLPVLDASACIAFFSAAVKAMF